MKDNRKKPQPEETSDAEDECGDGRPAKDPKERATLAKWCKMYYTEFVNRAATDPSGLLDGICASEQPQRAVNQFVRRVQARVIWSDVQSVSSWLSKHCKQRHARGKDRTINKKRANGTTFKWVQKALPEVVAMHGTQVPPTNMHVTQTRYTQIYNCWVHMYNFNGNVGLVANDVVCRMEARIKIGNKRGRVSTDEGDVDDDDDDDDDTLSLKDPPNLASDGEKVSPKKVGQEAPVPVGGRVRIPSIKKRATTAPAQADGPAQAEGPAKQATKTTASVEKSLTTTGYAMPIPPRPRTDFGWLEVGDPVMLGPAGQEENGINNRWLAYGTVVRVSLAKAVQVISYGGAKVSMIENTVAIHVVRIFDGVGMGKLIILNDACILQASAKKALNVAIKGDTVSLLKKESL
eukprot:9504151-Pyramimonas_sp.AAC.1